MPKRASKKPTPERALASKAPAAKHDVERPTTTRALVTAAAIRPGLPVTIASSMFDISERIEGDTLERIREDLGECTRCRLHTTRNKIVFGAGNEHAELVFVGEGPGRDEDMQGLPFDARSGVYRQRREMPSAGK
jgi:hypothetical protein